MTGHEFGGRSLRHFPRARRKIGAFIVTKQNALRCVSKEGPFVWSGGLFGARFSGRTGPEG